MAQIECGPFDCRARTYREHIATLLREKEEAEAQIKALGDFILAEVPGEPSQNQGAVDMAVRVIRTLTTTLAAVRAHVQKVRGMVNGAINCEGINFLEVIGELDAALTPADVGVTMTAGNGPGLSLGEVVMSHNLMEATTAALRLAHEWAAKYPLGVASTPADQEAARAVYEACEQVNVLRAALEGGR